ncbi:MULTISPECIES: hypothetical protein [Streptomyces]|uniref:Uncharacterized protein n=2 Tax=Streptomyces TaxID=1883 RepID=A0A100Y2D9_9ACTN|nr:MULTISPECIES: hypothetical protein [Streptomyces]KUH36436.1 hypothetical protein ATE80_23485 [Streptomyces kanasensis]UUS32369.1 hypothetical protein NRO40_17170 [Streptomyces changanensis]
MTPEPPADAEAAARRLRVVFTETAHDITPAPVPLAAIERAGRARLRRRSAALATGCALAVTAVALTLTQVLAPARSPSPAAPATPVPGPTVPPSPSRPASPPAVPPRVVAAGERVDAGRGWKVWLTAEGKHWSGPDGFENFRSVTDGNIDLGEPGLSHQSEGDQKGTFHSGVYHGTKGAARVELTGPDGTRTSATLLELPGSPGWGVWYATTPPAPDGDAGGDRLALYDAAGTLLAALPG